MRNLRVRRQRFAALAVVLFCGGCASPSESQSSYRILITNDDGIESPGIQALARELTAIGSVVVVAPCGQQSGASLSLDLRQPLQLRTFDRAEGFVEHCVDTTPGGAALLAITTLAPDGGFDLVVSGINSGANVGIVSHGSGTVGGAMMGAWHGIPAIAASLGGPARDFDYAAEFVTSFARALMSEELDAGIVYSINIPQARRSGNKGVVFAPMGGSYLEIGYDEVEGEAGERLFRPRFDAPKPYPVGSDSEAFADDMITITPLAFDWTAHGMLDDLRKLSLSP